MSTALGVFIVLCVVAVGVIAAHLLAMKIEDTLPAPSKDCRRNSTQAVP